jgi:hypothetical protein
MRETAVTSLHNTVMETFKEKNLVFSFRLRQISTWASLKRWCIEA